MATLATYTAETGAAVLIKMDGKQIGYASRLDIQEEYGAEQVYVISSIMPQENVNNRFSVNATLSNVMMRLDELVQNGIIKVAADVLRRADFNVEVIDLASGATKKVIAGCALRSRSHNIQANQISTGSMALIGLDMVEQV